MNGGNSNTSGANVANVGFWPSGVLAAVIENTALVSGQLEKIQSEDALKAAVDFIDDPQGKIPNARMEEIARRLVVTVEKQLQGNVIFSPAEPADHTKAWMPTDAVTGLPTDGKIRTWDEDTSAWVLADTQGGYVPPKKRPLKRRVAAGGSTVNLEFADIGTNNYYVTLTFTTQNDDGTWATPPGAYPAAFGYLVTNKTNTQLSVAFYGVPTGGLMIDGFIEEIIP